MEMLDLGSGSPTDLTDVGDLVDSDDRVRSLVVGGVIGAGALLTLCLFIACGILHCYFTSDKGNDGHLPKGDNKGWWGGDNSESCCQYLLSKIVMFMKSFQQMCWICGPQYIDENF